MKNILALTGLVLSLNAYADSSCSFQLTNRNFGPIAVMKIQNAEVVQELKEKFPYNDCYNGVCAFTFNQEDDSASIYFSNVKGNGHWASGQAAQYQTAWTDNGMWLFINSDKQSFGHLFKDGCAN